MRRLPAGTDMAFAPDGRLFVTLKSGVVRTRRTTGTVGTLLNFSRKVNDSGERGLLGVAVDPRFAANHHLYLVYTHRATGTLPIHNRLVRVTVRDGKLAPGSERLLSGSTASTPPTTSAARSRSAATESCTSPTARTAAPPRRSRWVTYSARSCV